jgi:hypothetical protein
VLVMPGFVKRRNGPSPRGPSTKSMDHRLQRNSSAWIDTEMCLVNEPSIQGPCVPQTRAAKPIRLHPRVLSPLPLTGSSGPVLHRLMMTVLRWLIWQAFGRPAGHGLGGMESDESEESTASVHKARGPRSSFRGVCWNPRMNAWMVQVGWPRRKLIGHYRLEVEAAKAYDRCVGWDAG